MFVDNENWSFEYLGMLFIIEVYFSLIYVVFLCGIFIIFFLGGFLINIFGVNCSKVKNL